MILGQLSAVVQLLYAGQPVDYAKFAFLLDGKPFVPLAKAQAFYAFSNLDNGKHLLDVISVDHFFQDQQLSFSVPLAVNSAANSTTNSAATLAQSIIVCTLEPSVLYPYPETSSLIRGKVSLADGKPLAGVKIKASYQTTRAQSKQVSTCSANFARYNGRYALALQGQLPPQVAVTLEYERQGYTTVKKQIQMQSGSMQLVDIEMH